MAGQVAELERQLAERDAQIAQLLATRNPQNAEIEAARAPPNALVFTVPQAGELLGISRNSAYEAAKVGTIPTVKIGGRMLVPRAALMRMLDVQIAEPTATT